MQHNRFRFKRVFLILIICSVMFSSFPSQTLAAPGNRGNDVIFSPPSTTLISEYGNPAPIPEISQQLLMNQGETIRVSVAANGEEGNGHSVSPSISADGRYIAFSSDASNLVSGDSNGEYDIFVRDVEANTTVRVSVASNGEQANGWSDYPSISADGRFIAFRSYASNLGSQDTNETFDIFVYDRQTGAIEPVSVALSGDMGNCYSSMQTISADGRYMAFESCASDLVIGDTNATYDIFVRDMQEKTTTRISLAFDGTQLIDGARFPSISADGQYVSFTSYDSNVVDGDTNGMYDIFVRDWRAGSTRLVSVATNGTQGNQSSDAPSISGDGRYIAFSSSASNLVSDDTNGGSDVFVRDMWMNTTMRVSFYVDGRQILDAASMYPSISADGRYIVYQISGFSWNPDYAYMYDTQVNATTEVSVNSQGEYMPGYEPYISSDGKYVAFSSDRPGVSEDTNGFNDVFVHKPVVYLTKPPLILVHGWQGLSQTGGYHCSDGIYRYQRFSDTYSNSTLKAEDDTSALADWLKDWGYDVWIAHLETGPNHTDSLEQNAKCLRDQIKSVASINPRPITVVAHSMGGLVSRAAIGYLDSSAQVKALYTLGSPNAGLPTDVLVFLLGAAGSHAGGPIIGAGLSAAVCKWQTGACDMGTINVNGAYSPIHTLYNNPFNKRHPNLPGVSYSFIGGDGGSGPLDRLLRLTRQGPNDGLVGQSSAVGWIYNELGVPWFSPSGWADASVPNQYWTDETHPAQSNVHKSYYVTPPGQEYSNAFNCMLAIMRNETPGDQYCWEAGTPKPQTLKNQAALLPSEQSSITAMKVGHLDAGQSVVIPFVMDSTGSSQFYLTWNGENTPEFTLTTPDLQVIDPIYAATHPEEVDFEIALGGSDTPPYNAYSFITGEVGIWKLNITASGAIDYQAFGMTDSDLVFSVETNDVEYRIGETATISATLFSSDIGLQGATIIAKISRPDNAIDEVPLADLGDGAYEGEYVIPSTPGTLTMGITADGNDNGTIFTRQENLLIGVASDDLQLTGIYNDQPRDDNSDGLYEYLDFTAEVNLAVPGEYAVSAELYAGDQIITQSGDFFQLISGTQTITLSFDGRDINKAGLDGPYTIKNLYFTPIELGITAQSVETAWTTLAYSHTQFADASSPIVSNITRVNPNPTNLASVKFTVTFSEPVTGVDFGDFSLMATDGINGALVTDVNGVGTVYVVTVNTGTYNANSADLININTATLEQLDSLPGIGPTTAQKIIDYRTVHGPFQCSEDIMNVSGIGPSTFEKIKNLITVGLFLRLDVIDDDTIMDASNNKLGGLGLGNGDFTRGEYYTLTDSSVFTDVPSTYWAWNFIERLHNAGITGGCSASPLMYCPEASVTRAQMAVFLLRGIHGSAYTPPAATGTVFADVPSTYWAAAWIEQLYVEGITGGCSGGNYCPETPVTRDQMAVFLLRAKHSSAHVPPAPTGVFSDVPTNYWSAAWIEELAAEGITSGCGGGNYCPEAVVTRAQMAVFLVKTFSLP